jgi:hypothetical protein
MQGGAGRRRVTNGNSRDRRAARERAGPTSVTFSAVLGFRREVAQVEREVHLHARRAQLRYQIDHDASSLSGGADASRNDRILAIPCPATTGEVVVPNTRTALARVDDALVPRVDRHVTDRLSVLREHDQITGPQVGEVQRDATAGGRLRARGSRETNAMLGEHVLHVARAIEARTWRRAAPLVLHSEIALRGWENDGGATSGGNRPAGLNDTAGGSVSTRGEWEN